MNEQLIEQRFKQLEEATRTQQEEIKELNRRVNSHDTSIAKIELIVESMKTEWAKLQVDIRTMLETQANNQNNQTNAFKEITLDLIKMTGIIVAAILGAKLFLG